MADNLSIIGPNAAICVNNVAYWMGVDKFYAYNGRVEPLPCSLRKFVFGRINREQGYQVHAGHNEGFNEIWWFYCTAGSTSIDSYVIYNYVDNTWAYGSMARTAWLDSSLRTAPVATSYEGVVLFHEQGTDDGSTNPPSAIVAFAESADFDIDDGQHFTFVRRMLPDVTFDGSSVNQPAITMSLAARAAPGSPYEAPQTKDVRSAQNYVSTQEFLVQEFTPEIFPRLRGRQMRLRIESTDVGVAWQLGAPRIDVRQDGRK